MAQTDLMGDNVTQARKDEIKREETTRKFVKKAKRERGTSVLGQIRLGGGRIHKKTIEFHESKGNRRKDGRKRRQKTESEKAERVEQSTLFE